VIRSLTYALTRSPARFLLLLVDIGSVNPLVVYQVVVAAQYPSVTSAALVPILALLGHAAINIRLMLRLGLRTLHTLKGCLAKGLTGTTLRVSDILKSRYPEGLDTYHDLERWLTQFNGIFSWRLDDMVAIHYAPGSGVFTTYTHSQFFRSHIFISAIPATSSPLQRFFFLHELFHVLLFIVTRPIDMIAALPAQLCLAVWAVYSLAWSAELIGPVLALSVTVLAWHERAIWNLRRLRVSSESIADAAAISYLDDEDLKHLAKSRILASLEDKELTLLENATRRSSLQGHINLALSGSRDALIDRSLEDLAITTPRWITILFLCCVVLLASHAEAPMTTQLWVAGGALLAAIFLFALSALLYTLLRGALSASIDRQFPESSEGVQ
jgi:hypothetical protein